MDMFKNAMRSIYIIWSCSKISVFLKIIQCVCIAIATPLSIYFTQLLIEIVTLYTNGMEKIENVFILVVLLLASILLISSFSFFDNLINISIQRNVNRKLLSNIINKFLSIDYACFEDKNIADTINRMGNSPQHTIVNIFHNTLNSMTLIFSIVGTSIVFSQVSVWFVLFYFLILVPMLWLDYRAMVMMNNILIDQTEQERKLNYLSGLLDNKKSLLELKVFNAVEYILTKWKALNKTVLNERVKITIKSQKYFAISTAFMLVWIGVVVATLIFKIYHATISSGIFIAIISSTITILGLGEGLSRSFASLSRSHLIMKHYYTFVALPELENGKSEKRFNNFDNLVPPHIVFDNVYFSYPNSNVEVLKGVSMDISPNKHIALVGENGSGKSTIIKLLCKLYRPTSGKITINDIDINDLSFSDLKKTYSVVFQDYVRYSLSLRENIAFGNIAEIYDDNAIVNVINEGMLSEVLCALKCNLDANLGKIEENGVDLSGGQWQRIAISRALFSNSKFVILDEPTASLDPMAESDMYRGFLSLLHDKGCLLISHRLASAKMADLIYVLKDGKIIEKGTHDELMVKQGLYSNMYESQSCWYNADNKDRKVDNEQ